MAAWVYKCEKCGKSFLIEVEADAEAAEAVDCPYCEGARGVKAFEVPDNKGGCGCGGGSCC